MSSYTPRRMPKRFLDGAPDYVLDIIDHGPNGPHDRYDVLFGKSEMCRANSGGVSRGTISRFVSGSR